ncbi:MULTISPECIES: LacI family DNA-binding transcriptional regulator [Bifidobacterium]|uniref:LacI family DNA-binding transcriptional regulator n=1 Tax=Bifidobacterium TaxID=1678 RepID=UPI0018DC3F08|nr:LacI family DNA-binding transcriptional regulator [Bifidobacterium asteroides]MBI0100389.1 LacI family DNA-binding transcriptional regulator [Bifidobacterium sp. W8114]
MTTLDDVAGEAGVSRMTASNALRGKSSVKPATARRVLEAAERLGYRPNLAARRLSSGRSGIIGFSTVELDRSPFSAALAAAVSDQAVSMGYQTLIQQTRQMASYESSMVADIATQFCEGTILSAPALSADSIAALNRRYPLVVFDGPQLDRSVDTVRSPNRKGAQAAVEHLIDHGCRRILVLGASYKAPDQLVQSSLGQDQRLLGAMQAAQVHGIRLGPEDVVDCDWEQGSADQAMAVLLARRRNFDGVFALTDVVAIGALHALEEHGVRVPEQVALIGFDGLEVSRFLTPALSTIRVDTDRVAAECLRLLMARMKDLPGRHQPEQVHLPFTLVEAGSTAQS